MFLLVLIVIGLVVAVVRLRRDLSALREELESVKLGIRIEGAPVAQFAAIERRVTALEREVRSFIFTGVGSRPDASPSLEPTAESDVQPKGALAASTLDGATDLQPSTVEHTGHDESGERIQPVTEDTRLPFPRPAPPRPQQEDIWRPTPAAAVSASETRTAEPLIGLPPVTPAHPARPTVAEAAPPDTSAETWEVVVGTSWLNKIGVVVFVVGVALLLGYSMAHVGPLGRVAMGYALSLAMLGTGVVLERREPYRQYAYGLVGGGWAGIYFTAFAMHALPAARVVESDVVATASLVLVAAGMVAHSVRYGSQTLTGLAYVAAYAPLAFSPLSLFSLVAAVPLTATLLIVASRFAWPGVAVLGVVSAYGIFVLRTAIAPSIASAGTALAVLWSYWLLFEIADIASRRRQRAGVTPAPLFVLNAAGFLGALVINTPPDARQWLVIGSAASAYLASACARAWLVGRRADRPEAVLAGPFSTVHAATLLAAAMFAYAVELRFSGTRQTVALLLETELLVAAGMALRDTQIRRIGTALAVLTTAHLLPYVVFDSSYGFQSLVTASSTAALVAVAWYANFDWIDRRHEDVDLLEHLYRWVALILVTLLVVREVGPFHQGVVMLVWALVLLEAGLRRADHYRQESYAALAVGALLTMDVFFLGLRGVTHTADVDLEAETLRHSWSVLPVAAALAYLFAARLGVRARREGVTAHALVIAAAATLGTAFVALFEYRVTASYALGAVWAGTAAIASVLAAWRRFNLFRWHAVALASAAVFIPLGALLFDRVDTRPEYAATVGTIILLYVTGYVGRLRTTGLVASALGAVALAGSALQAMFVWRVVPADAVASVWAASGVVLCTMGALRHRAGQRWQAYALVALANLRALLPLEAAVLSSAQIISSALVIALTYLAGYLGRRLTVRVSAAISDEERGVMSGLSFLGTAHLAALIPKVLPIAVVPAALAVAASVLVALGVARRRIGQRVQGYGLFAVSGVQLLGGLAVSGASQGPARAWAALAIGSYYTAGLLLRRATRQSAGEEHARLSLLVGATVLLSALLANELGVRLVTLPWALQGALLWVVGFMARERVLRLSGLALLFLCIVKLFAYDLQQLDALARILSFVVLGLLLLAVSWAYTRYREQIRRLL